MDKFIVGRRGMTCGSAEAEARKFQIAVDRNQKCVWFYTLEDADPAGHVYVHDPTRTGSDGFAGRTIVFQIGKSATYHAQGPWHANSDALFNATGVDLRDKSLTFVVVALNRSYDEQHRAIYEDILYIDKEPTLGKFDRGDDIARKFADERGHPVACYRESSGGSSSGFVLPTGTEHKNWHDWFAERLAAR